MACGLIAAWTTLLWLASATGLEPSGSMQSLTISTLSTQSVDLLATLGLHNNTWPGVTIGPGPPPKLRPAYYLQGDYRDLKLPPSAFQQVADLLRKSPEFTISAWLRQEVGNTGTIVSFAHGLNRYLELQSSGRKNEIRLHYTSRLDSKVYVESFHYKLADNVWHHVAVSVSGTQVELIIDCHSLYKKLLRPLDRNFTEPQQLWLGQRNKHYHFKGAMLDVRLTTGQHGYLNLCPSLESTCPTCGEFSLLQNTVQELTRHLQELSERLVAAEGRLTRVEDCDCRKSCHADGTVYADGTTWQHDCDLCSCVHGEVQCHPVKCPEVACKHPVKKHGDCCNSCLQHCYLSGQFFDHGEIVTIKKCVECECMDGSMDCNRLDPETMCPKLTCPPEQQFSVPDNCCKFCPDIDECQQEGGLEGHHCHLNTVCVNTPGSYKCECLNGYRSTDKFNCIEEDECSTGIHNCDENADCINTQGSYHCKCRDGYSGDGYTCQPVCEQNCLNGGICRRPGKCACPNGYTGKSCERDLDECATNSHRCADTSECVNMIGWYYCQCKEGYQSRISDNNLGTLCDDIDECQANLHTCHPTATCVNTNGHYRCECSTPDCKLSCLYENVEVMDGATIQPTNIDKKCQICTCNRGVITCMTPKCDCSLPGADRNKCCPQCDKKHACQHQELTNVTLMHGEQWSYQCQTCECEYGEIDCWDMKCPPLLCENAIHSPGDCCPHCDNPCPMGNASGSGMHCVYGGRMYESGAQFADPNDSCVSCNCKDGELCCSYTYDCVDDEHAIGYDGLVATQASGTGHPTSSTTKSASANPNPSKQPNAPLRTAANSDIYVRDSLGSNKTEKASPAG